MKMIAKIAAAALFTVSAAGAAHAGGLGFGGSGFGGGLLNVSPSVGVSALNGSSVASGNKTTILSGILNGNSVANGNGVLNNLLGGNSYSVRSSKTVTTGHSGSKHRGW